MITEKDLQEAIAECQGVRNPNAGTCMKLAAFLTIQREMFGNPEHLPTASLDKGYSFDAAPYHIDYRSDTEFASVISTKAPAEIWPVFDELMSTLQAINPRLYAAVIRKLKS